MIPEKSDIEFNGIYGITCYEFIQSIKKYAFDEGKSKDNDWMAEIASFRFSGPALRWFEELDDATQEDWKLLKRALLRQYVEPSYEATTKDRNVSSKYTPHEFVFEGKDEKEAENFVRFIRQRAFQVGKSEDDKWMADFAATQLLGMALRWHSELSQSTRLSWKLLERATLETFSSNIQTVGLDAKRISISHWYTITRASSLRFPASKEEWVELGKKRRADMTLPSRWKVIWHLVVPGEHIPVNAIPICSKCSYVYSIRAWHEGGLTIGKYVKGLARTVNFRLLSPALTKTLIKSIAGSFIPWRGKEILYDGPFEVLIGDSTAVRWVCPGKDAFVAVEGGFEVAFESALLVARVKEGEGWLPAKVFSADHQAYFGLYWKEHRRPIEEVQVLAWEA